MIDVIFKRRSTIGDFKVPLKDNMYTVAVKESIQKVTPELLSPDDDENSIAENGSTICGSEYDQTYRNDDSEYSDYETDDSFQEFNIKDWLKLAKVTISKHVTPVNKCKLTTKYDELEDFFYFFALEYFSGDQNLAELIESKKSEFLATWQEIIGPCGSIFDMLVDLMGDINVENSFRLC